MKTAKKRGKEYTKEEKIIRYKKEGGKKITKKRGKESTKKRGRIKKKRKRKE